MRLLLTAGLLALIAGSARAEDAAVPMFNGKDLTGWVNVNCGPKTFTVRDECIVTDGRPTGFLRTENQYENFVLEMDWMHTNTKEVGNSGLFVWGDPLPAVGTGYTRGIEVQVLVNLETDWATSHGDLFSIWGAKCKPDRPHPKGYARCLPSERRCKGGGEWNHYKVIAQDGSIKLHVNGKEVSGVSECNPRKGYLALESEGAECRFKNLTIVEKPSTMPAAAQTADVAAGHQSLYTGLDFTGWTPGTATDWKAGEVITCTGTTPLTSDAVYGKGQLIFDFKSPGGDLAVTLGTAKLTLTAKPNTWTRATLNIAAGVAGTVGKEEFTMIRRLPTQPGPIAFAGSPKLELRNLFFQEAK